jgi:hypothetical protein
MRHAIAQVDDPRAATVLDTALGRGIAVVALNVEDRMRILDALDDPPEGTLSELRGVRLQEYEWRRRQGLV